MGMTFTRLLYLIRTDCYRYHGHHKPLSMLKALFFNRGFKISTCYRIAHFLYVNNRKFLLNLFNLYYFHLQSLYCCELPYQTQIGPGFYFGHVFGTVINARCVLGKNVNMSHAVTLGMIKSGKRSGAPVIGDHVYIAPGAKIVGNVRVGSGSAIGANAVVTKDTPENAVVVGIPGEVISLRGSADYCIRTVEEDLSAKSGSLVALSVEESREEVSV